MRTPESSRFIFVCVFWQVFQSPSFWTVLVLTVLPLYGISVYTYVLLFAFIERTDEYQLVSFICRFKAIQFLVQGAGHPA